MNPKARQTDNTPCFHIGSLDIKIPIIYSPLAGCSDLPMRLMGRKYHPGLIFTEMIKIEALIRHEINTYRILDYKGSEHPIGAQICGTNPESAAEAAKIVQDLGFDLVDLNCGCPVDKVTKDGSGSGMLKNPKLIAKVISSMKSAVSIPVTLKIRAGWDESNRNAPLISKIAEDAGADAVFVHGRTRKQAYQGKADRSIIKECKRSTKSIPVIGNGDVFDAGSAIEMFESTGCDAVLVSRGSMGQPWISEDITRALNGDAPLPRPPELIQQNLLEHFEHILRHQTPHKAVLDMRRVGCWYLKRCEGTKPLKQELNKSKCANNSIELIKNFSFSK